MNSTANDDDEFNNSIDLSHYDSSIYGMPNLSTGEKLKQWTVESTVNAEEIGDYLEGDILIVNRGRNALIDQSFRWPNGIIKFEIMGNFNANEMQTIEDAITEFHHRSCIKFVPKTSEDRDYVSLQRASTGCWSSVGKIGGRQVMNLQSPECLQKLGTVIHEFLHVCGLQHEQNREERDSFVTINEQNIRHGTETNFAKVPPGTTSGYGVTYDYASVMHYSPYAFSVNGQRTIVTKKTLDTEIGQRIGFSKGDVEKLNKMYECSGTTTSASGYKPTLAISNNWITGISDLFHMIIPFDDDDDDDNSVTQK